MALKEEQALWHQIYMKMSAVARKWPRPICWLKYGCNCLFGVVWLKIAEGEQPKIEALYGVGCEATTTLSCFKKMFHFCAEAFRLTCEAEYARLFENTVRCYDAEQEFNLSDSITVFTALECTPGPRRPAESPLHPLSTYLKQQFLWRTIPPFERGLSSKSNKSSVWSSEGTQKRPLCFTAERGNIKKAISYKWRVLPFIMKDSDFQNG